MKHILSFDFEEWYQLAHRRLTGELPPPRDTLYRQTDRLLALLSEKNVKATFFILGLAADEFPDLVKEIAKEGHEIASHGYSHFTVSRLTREEFRADILRGKQVVEDLSGAQIRGFRAPEFSIQQPTLWALEVLAECGFEYDSSIFPIRHRRYGIPGFSPRPARYTLRNGCTIAELPLAAVRFRSTAVPVAGGGYFRLLPATVLRSAMRRLERDLRPMVTYFHPYEFDLEPLDVFYTLNRDSLRNKLTGNWFNFLQNLNRPSLAKKLEILVSEFEFSTCAEYLRQQMPVAELATA